MSTFLIEKSTLVLIEYEANRANRFISQCEIARKQAFEFKDAKFFVGLAYQRAFLSQVCYLQGASTDLIIDLLRQAVSDFLIGLELGYPTEAIEINNWFYRSLVANDNSLSHFLASLPAEVWSYGETFPRFQAYWGFAQLRRQPDEAMKCLDFLYGWCFESGDDPEENEEDQQINQLEQNGYHIMHAIFTRDTDSAVQYLHERSRLRPIIPPEGTRYELFQPLDLLGLGLCAIAKHSGLSINLNEPSIPLILLRPHGK